MLFGKKTKETTYNESELYIVKSIMSTTHWIVGYNEHSRWASVKDVARAIEICNDCISKIDAFHKRNPELESMFTCEKQMVETYRKLFYLALEEKEQSAE